MDIQIPFIFVSLFSLASVVLIFIYKFGIKEKSYEEALAEQRQQTHILLGIKPKLKEKKNKKPSKKLQSGVKEKITIQEGEVLNDGEQPEPGHKKLHVEFKEDAEDVSTKVVISKKQTKKEKVRPILINKEKIEDGVDKNIDEVVVPANHFEELHPKDDFELFRSASSEEPLKEEPEKSAPPTDDLPKQVQKKQFETESVLPQKENVSTLTTPPVNGIIGNSGKEKKKKKSEFNNLQQQLAAGDNNGPNMTVLLNLVRKAELSRSEVQILIDLLLNKQHEAPAVIDEWSEGKSDPVQKLKKQLAEKEKLLSEEQQALANAQAKLRDIRSEYQNEKSALHQKMRNMEELLQSKHIEVTRGHQQVQQLQTLLKEEEVKLHKLREENAAFQLQRQQYELRFSQTQESEVIIGQLQSETQQLSSLNEQLRMELTHLTEENIAEKERNQAFLLQLNTFQKESEQKNERSRQLEETRIQLERELETVLKRENDLKMDVSRLNNAIQQQKEELRRLEHTSKQYHDDLQKHKDESGKIINQLTTDLRQAQEENVQIKVTHMNGSLQENKQYEVEILNLHNELTSVKTQLNHTEKESEKELKAAHSLTEKLQQELDELRTKFNEEKLKLEEQKNKNNALRERNWKVMEALNAAECRLKSNPTSLKTKSDEDIQREFIQRLFPEVKDQVITNPELFKTGGEQFIRKYVEDLRKHTSSNGDQDAQLKLQLQHYKNVIDNTEKMLNKLQTHIEHEEINWRKQLAAKTEELEAIKNSHKQELQKKLRSLESELKKEQEDKKKLIAQFQSNNFDAQSSSNI